MKTKYLAAIAIMTTMISGLSACSSKAKVTSVTANAFETAITVPGTQILDVRTPAEYSRSHIDGAENINVADADFVSRATMALSKDKPVYVYCRSGKRSLAAADSLARHGYRVVNLDTGLNGWKQQGLPVIGQKDQD